MKKITIIDAFDPHLIGASFSDLSTWGSWIAALKAAHALPMTEAEFALYQKCTGRSRSLESPAREVYFLVGRGAARAGLPRRCLLT